VRDGARGLEYAKKALDLTHRKWPVYETLAAAHAEAGQFREAVQWQEKALAAPLPPADREEAQARLELYRKRQPYREPVR
jgi:serine/threonine-protein kinase